MRIYSHIARTFLHHLQMESLLGEDIFVTINGWLDSLQRALFI